MLEPFRRPEDEMRECQALASQLEGLLNLLKKDIDDVKVDLLASEIHLAELFEEQHRGGLERELGQAISELLRRLKSLQDNLQNRPNDQITLEMIEYVKHDLSSIVEQKMMNETLTGTQFVQARADIAFEKHRLLLMEEYLSTAERNKVEILKDKAELMKAIEDYNKKWQSKN